MKKTNKTTKVSFTNFTDELRGYLHAFQPALVALAKSDAKFKVERKALLEKRDAILAQREQDIKNGISVDDAIRENSIIDLETKIKKLENAHKEEVKPLNEDIKKCYAFIPEGLYDAYKIKIIENNETSFLEKFDEFLLNIGIECGSKAVRAWSRKLSTNIGAACTSTATIAKAEQKGEEYRLTRAMSKTMFNKLFMSTFIDLFIK